jgi:hypothetical protein
MRTKTLLLSAVALAAGLVSSQAQSNVYSANVVGYCSVVIAGNAGYTLIANPFDDGNGNQLTNLFPGTASLPTGSQVLTWDPVAGYSTAQLGGSPLHWNHTVTLTPGTGFFVKNGAGASAPFTNTFVGSVIVPNGSSVTNGVALHYSLQASPIPYTGNVASNTVPNGDAWMDFGSSVGTGSQILTWDPIAGYTTAQKGGATPHWNKTVTVNPGQGFFLFNSAGPATNVVETLNLQ